MGKAMERPERQRRLDDFLAGLGSAGQGVLLLDYDGTLAPFSLRTLVASGSVPSKSSAT